MFSAIRYNIAEGFLLQQDRCESRKSYFNKGIIPKCSTVCVTGVCTDWIIPTSQPDDLLLQNIYEY
jgi:hypothetical protein